MPSAVYPDESSKRGKNKRCTWKGNGVAVDVKSFKYAVQQCKRGDCSDGDEARASILSALARAGRGRRVLCPGADATRALQLLAPALTDNTKSRSKFPNRFLP